MVAFSYRGSEPAEQHKALLEAALRRDADAAVATLLVHVNNCVEHALGVSFANADVEWEGRVVSAHHKLASTDRLMENGLGELEQWKRYDGEFHQALISNCGSRTLMEMHALVFDKYFRYQMVAFSYRGSEPAEQHKALLEAALKRDAKAATATLRTHVNNCVEHALATASLK